MSDEQMRAAFEVGYAKKWGLDLRRYVGMHHYCAVETEAQWKAYQAAAQQYQPLVDVRLLNDAIALITKSLASLLTDSNFSSPYVEDHRPSTPKWVIARFAADYDRRVAYVNDIKQSLDWIRNATEKVRSQALATIEQGGVK